MVQAEAALALGDAGGALRELKACASRWPESALVWNLVTRALALQARVPGHRVMGRVQHGRQGQRG